MTRAKKAPKPGKNARMEPRPGETLHDPHLDVPGRTHDGRLMTMNEEADLDRACREINDWLARNATASRNGMMTAVKTGDYAKAYRFQIEMEAIDRLAKSAARGAWVERPALRPCSAPRHCGLGRFEKGELVCASCGRP